MIEIKGLEKRFKDVLACSIEELELMPGQRVGLLGSNGAGKTTLFRLMLDLLPVDKGWVKMDGVAVHESEEWKKKTGAFLDEHFLIDYLSPEEYFDFVATVKNYPNEDLKGLLIRLGDFFYGEVLGKKKLIRDFSKGNQKKIGIAAALIGDPQWLLLDEPFANLDPAAQYRLIQLLQDLQKERKFCTFISSHDLDQVVQVSDRLIIMDKGRVARDAPKTENSLQEVQSYFQDLQDTAEDTAQDTAQNTVA